MAPPLSQDRLVRKEVALGLIRGFEPPQNHIGTRLLAPMMDVESDDVIFNYTRGLTAGLAPARAEDSESELAQKDDSVGYGRAAIIDWALKDHYDPSDVTRYREGLIIGGMAGATALPLTAGAMVEGFQARLARDARIRRRKLDNRLEWMITQALETGGIVYNDGKIKFSVDYGRPAGQTTDVVTNLWSTALADPIGDLMSRKQARLDADGVRLTRAICSQRVINNLMKSDKWTNTLIGSNPLYTVRGWGVDAVRARVAETVEIEFIVYDSVYRTRALGSNTVVNTRFLSDNKVYMLPAEEDIDEIDDLIGFGATLTSPHPEGNWTSGFYEWEKDTGPDPWGQDVGSGIKMFPVFPHLNLTHVLTVL
jgi:hypothetical protein